MELKLSLENVNISTEEILLKLEEILKIDNTMYLSDRGIVMSERYGHSRETKVDPALFSAYCTIHDYLTKCNEYAEKTSEEENIQYIPVGKKGMKKLW